MIRIKIISLLIFLSAAITFAQQTVHVTGIVKDEAGDAVIGATVVAKGNSQLGTITDIDGKFSITLSSSNKILVVSYIGMKTREVEARPTMNIVLMADSKELDEVVVTGMLKVDKRLFTGATDQLDAAKTKIDGITDVRLVCRCRMSQELLVLLPKSGCVVQLQFMATPNRFG